MSKWVTTCLQCWPACATCAMTVPVKGLGHRQRVFHQCICPHQWAPLQRKKKEREREGAGTGQIHVAHSQGRGAHNEISPAFLPLHTVSLWHRQANRQCSTADCRPTRKDVTQCAKEKHRRQVGAGDYPSCAQKGGIGDIAVRTKADASERKSTEKCAIFTDRCTICAAYYYRHHFWLVKIETDWSGQSIERQISLHQY